MYKKRAAVQPTRKNAGLSYWPALEAACRVHKIVQQRQDMAEKEENNEFLDNNDCQKSLLCCMHWPRYRDSI